MTTDNISAIATPEGTGGVAVIRISGESPLEILEKMFRPLGKTRVADMKPNRMYVGNIEGEGFTDLGMAVYFRSPASFTGEDVVELHCHGGVYIARGIWRRTLSLGARAAERGEFTRRAFINGKLTLASAEGMIDMINADSLAAVRAGNMMYFEKLSESVKGFQSRLTDILAEIAADMDYPEENDNALSPSLIVDRLREIKSGLDALAGTYSCGKLAKHGVSVAICGKPNVGKSSLLNALLGYDKAIVSDEAGTTRDIVEGSLEIGGVRFNFSDTAGLRGGAGAVESIGIERALRALSEADVILAVSDGGECPVPLAHGRVIKVFNKCDVLTPCGGYDVAVSAKTGEGIDGLTELIGKTAAVGTVSEGAYVVEGRHYSALLRAAEALGSAVENAGYYTSDILSVDIREAWLALGEITGESADEEIISAVFEKFCVGK